MNGAVRPGDLVRLHTDTANAPASKSTTVLEVFDDPKAPLAYIGSPDWPPRWVFASNLEVIAAAVEGEELRPPA